MQRPNSSTAIEAVRAKTSRAQADAADPLSSAWVSANAGTGKTHVLTMRVLRLLLAGTKPERILCLTYTKAPRRHRLRARARAARSTPRPARACQRRLP